VSAVVVGRSPKWATVVVAAVYASSAVACCLLAAFGQAKFTDLHVYRLGGEAVLHGGGLYGFRFAGLPFTYPPFAAVVFTVLAALPWAVAASVLTVASAVAVPVMLFLALRLQSAPSSILAPGSAWRLALAVAAAAIWLEPVRTTLGYGQIDLFLAAGVLYDLRLPDSARSKGAVIGLAAGLKLTPLIFIGYLLVTRRYRAAVTAAAAFAATIAVGFAFLPADSAHYWDVTFLNPGRVSPVQNVENQSLMGALARTLHTAQVGYLWLPVAIVVALAGLALAVRAQRAGDEAAGFSLCAITGLLVSPISWTHHWVIAVPALLLAAVACYRSRAEHRAWANLGLAAIAAVAVIGWVRLAREVSGSDWLHLPMLGIVYSEVYVVAGLAALAVALGLFLSSRRRGRLALADLPGPPDPGQRTARSKAGLRADSGGLAGRG
jgi:alpha-1,2-mannosyltransferase